MIPPKQPDKIIKGQGFEDEDFKKNFSESKLDKFVSKQETKEDPLVEEIKDEDHAKSTKEEEDSYHSSVYLKRDALYKDLKMVNVSVENSSTLEVIKDFLRNKINSKEQIKSLKQQIPQNNTSQKISIIIERARRHYGQDGSGEPGDIKNMIQKMAMETLNESGQYSSMDQKEKLAIFKDLETLLGVPPTGMDVQSPITKESNKIEELSEEEVKKMSEEEEVKKMSEEEKEPSTKSSPDKIKDIGKEIDEQKKSKWSFFGKIKEAFFNKKKEMEEEFEEEEEEEEVSDTLIEEMGSMLIEPPASIDRKTEKEILNMEEEKVEEEEKINT